MVGVPLVVHYWADLQVHGFHCYDDIALNAKCQRVLLLTQCLVIIRPHCSTTYVDAAYHCRPSSVVCRSVWHTSKPCKNSCTDRDAVWVEDSGGPKKPCIRWGSRSSHGKGQFRGGNGRPLWSIVTLCSQLCKNRWTDWDAWFPSNTTSPGPRSTSLPMPTFLHGPRCN